jgi:ribosome-associated protein
VYDKSEGTSLNEEIPGWLTAVRAAEAKQAVDIKVLDLTGVTSFTDHFVICTGNNPKQCQAIADEVGLKLKAAGDRPNSVEGYETAEWILADYGDFLVHVFSPKAREYYSLDRLWRAAKEVPVPAE